MAAKRALGRRLLPTLVVGCCLVRAIVAAAADLTSNQVASAQQEQQQHMRQAQQLPRRLQEPQPVAQPLTRFPQLQQWLHRLHFYYGAIEGYDRNPRLGSPRKGSGFTEQDLGAGYLHRLGSKFIYRLSSHLRYVNYYKFANENLFEPKLRAETALELRPGVFLESEYDTLWFWQPDNAQGNFHEQAVKVGLKHYLIPRRLYHKPSYIFQYRGHTKAKARFADGTASQTERHDVTHRLDYEIGFHPVPQLLLRVNQQLGRNDSNDQLLDFYDYSFYQVTPSVTWAATDRLLLIGGVQFQHNKYDDRAVRGTAERENFTAVFGSVFYHVTPSVSVGCHWVYVKDDSNLPELEFQGSNFSAGLYIHF